jgi:hypothetical protein
VLHFLFMHVALGLSSVVVCVCKSIGYTRTSAE